MTKEIAIKIQNQEWYQYLIENLDATITESIYRSRAELIEGKWQVGNEIYEAMPTFKKNKIYGDGIVRAVAQSLKMNPRRIWECLQFREKYPDLDELADLPEGKNLSWHKITHKYLPGHNQDCKHEWEKVDAWRCKKCPAFRKTSPN